MRGLIKLGIMAAAAYGAYELARRYGLIEKAADWLEEQIPDDMKERAQQVGDKVMSGAERAVSVASDGVSRATGRTE
jgi:hypothetical protein